MAELQTRAVHVTTAFGTLAASVIAPSGAAADTPPVVVWPSVLSTARVQAALVEELAHDAVVVAVDPPGHGVSRIDDADALSMAACARATWDLLDEAFGPATGRGVRWVGTSWGGLVGLEAARAQPQRISHLACLNTPFAFEPPRAWRPAWLPLLGRLVGTTPLFAAMTARTFFLRTTRRDEARAQAMAAHRETFTGGDRRQLAGALRLLFVRRHDLRALLATTTGATLVVAGRHDGTYPVADQRRAAERNPLATFAVVDSAHIAAVDATAAVVSRLREAWADGGSAHGTGP